MSASPCQAVHLLPRNFLLVRFNPVTLLVGPILLMGPILFAQPIHSGSIWTLQTVLLFHVHSFFPNPQWHIWPCLLGSKFLSFSPFCSISSKICGRLGRIVPKSSISACRCAPLVSAATELNPVLMQGHELALQAMLSSAQEANVCWPFQIAPVASSSHLHVTGQVTSPLSLLWCKVMPCSAEFQLPKGGC